MYFNFVSFALLTGAEGIVEVSNGKKPLMLPCSLFTVCHKVNQIQQLCSNTVITGGAGGGGVEGHTQTHKTCMALMNTHSALYWRQRNASLDFNFDKCNAEQESQFRKQVFTSIKNEILFLPVIALPRAPDTF